MMEEKKDISYYADILHEDPERDYEQNVVEPEIDRENDLRELTMEANAD